MLDILTSLLGQRVIGRDGQERAMTLDDVLVVAPYNMQVNLLRSMLCPTEPGSAQLTSSKARRRRWLSSR